MDANLEKIKEENKELNRKLLEEYRQHASDLKEINLKLIDKNSKNLFKFLVANLITLAIILLGFYGFYFLGGV